ncbi:bifunctional sugar-1-phosphate nucleotidylyltransferase/acetyltransferase [Nanoarchaeota archaeon]
MQAILLAAGKSTRTYPLTLTKPKPLLKVANRSIIRHNLDQLVGLVDEVIIIVGYKKEMILDNLKDYKDIKLTFIEQKDQLGTGHALSLAKDMIKDKFILMNGDDLFNKKDIEACLKHDLCVLAMEVKNPEKFGIFELNENFVAKIIEKPKKPKSNLANTGLYVLNKKIFDMEMSESDRGEYEVVEAITKLAKTDKIHCETVKAYWLPIAYPWDLLNANEFFLKEIKTNIQGTVDKNATVKGNLIVGKGTQILPGVYIEGNVIIGDNCMIGPNCYIRGKTSIGNNCKVGQAVEIKNTIMMDNTKVPHLSYVGDSILGENVNFGAGTVTANLKHDHNNVKSEVKGELIDSGRKKLGAIIADNVHTGINTSLFPGRKIWPGLSTGPGEKVNRDVKQPKDI